MRIALGIEYDGLAFSGWQYQPHAPSVQAAVEKALSAVADRPVAVTCAGRTDAGVHATHQVVHLDAPVVRPHRAWLRGVNAHLPGSVRVCWVRDVPSDFHARFSAVARRYRYVISHGEVRPAIWRSQVAWTPRALDAERMRAGAVHLLGVHDFSAFRAAGCQARHPVRSLYRVDVAGCGEMITLDVEANAFLHHMVRNIAGVLMAVGSGEVEPDWVASVLASRDRTQAGVTAPGAGLYLVGIRYPQRYRIPRRGRLPRFA